MTWVKGGKLNIRVNASLNFTTKTSGENKRKKNSIFNQMKIKMDTISLLHLKVIVALLMLDEIGMKFDSKSNLQSNDGYR